MTKTHRKSCPPHPRLGAQPMHGSLWRELQLRTPALCPTWPCTHAFLCSWSRCLLSEASLPGDFGRSLSQVPLLRPLCLGDRGILKTLSLHSDPALSPFLFPALPFPSCSASTPATVHKTLRAFWGRISSQWGDSPQLGWSTGPMAEPWRKWDNEEVGIFYLAFCLCHCH